MSSSSSWPDFSSNFMLFTVKQVTVLVRIFYRSSLNLEQDFGTSITRHRVVKSSFFLKVFEVFFNIIIVILCSFAFKLDIVL